MTDVSYPEDPRPLAEQLAELLDRVDSVVGRDPVCVMPPGSSFVARYGALLSSPGRSGMGAGA